MTLLESLVALVILGLTAIGFLQAFQTSTRATRGAGDWVQAVSYAESAMEQTKLASAPSSLSDSLSSGYARSVDVRAWPVVPGVDRVTVTVTLPGGGVFVLERLVLQR